MRVIRRTKRSGNHPLKKSSSPVNMQSQDKNVTMTTQPVQPDIYSHLTTLYKSTIRIREDQIHQAKILQKCVWDEITTDDIGISILVDEPLARKVGGTYMIDGGLVSCHPIERQLYSTGSGPAKKRTSRKAAPKSQDGFGKKSQAPDIDVSELSDSFAEQCHIIHQEPDSPNKGKEETADPDAEDADQGTPDSP